MEIGLAVLVFFPFLAGILAWGIGRGSRGGGLERGGSKSSIIGGDGKYENRQSAVVIGAAVLEFAGMAALAVFGSGKPIHTSWAGGRALFLEIPEICGMGIRFTLDGFRAVYGCITAFMWMTASIFSREYFEGHKNQGRFYLFLLWTLGAVMGVLFSADLYTTFLFFEIMSFTSYVWVAQEEDKASLRAAGTYLAVAVLGGLAMLMGIFLLQYKLGTLAIGELAAAAAECGDKKLLYAAGVCMLVGFGAKAGVFPLHIWLPKAHPVAPAPASALLSGILTKTGIYGILILSCYLFPFDRYWGGLILALGVITMFGGALLAVFSIDLKRTLACSSMSQIGFILVGTGMIGLSGARSLEGLNMSAVHGVFLHMVNHSLIKLVLFLAAGVIHRNVHSMDLNVIRGFGRKKPLLAGCFLTGALAISGVPFFGGYISKTLLHESIVEYGGGGVMKMAEWIFLASGGLTAAYMTKLFLAIFVERNADNGVQEAYEKIKHIWKPAGRLAVTGSALLLFVWGMLPHGLMDRAARLAEGFFGPGAAAGAMGHGVSYFSLENLAGGFISIAIGAAVYLLFVRRVLMRGNEDEIRDKRRTGRKKYVNVWPERLDLEELLYRPLLLKILPAVFGVMCRILDSFVDISTALLRRTVYRNSPPPHERSEGNAFTEKLGKLLNRIQGVGNRTWRKKNPVHKDYVHLAAMKNEEFKENNLIIRRSLSFGLLLFCVGLMLTLMYLIWWQPPKMP